VASFSPFHATYWLKGHGLPERDGSPSFNYPQVGPREGQSILLL
jgi:hypothetical protein